MRTKIKIGIGVIAALVLGVVGFIVFWIVRSDSPDAVSMDAAMAQMEDMADGDDVEPAQSGDVDEDVSGDESVIDDGGSAEDGAGSSSTNEGSAEVVVDDVVNDVYDIAGTWTVNTSMVPFSSEDGTGSFVGYRVDEELTLGAVTAVGRTGDVTGSVELTQDQLVAATVTAEMATLQTDNSHRDGHARSALKVRDHPYGTFTLTEPIALPAGAADGELISAQAVGTLTLAGVTNSTVFDLEAQLADDIADVVVVTGSAPVVFADYDVETPSAPIVLSLDDHGVIEFQLFLTR